jgi:Cu(I)/Ag(I) efflux system membrane protein CusA/SilA
VETAAKGVPGVSSALAERLTGGRYVDVDIDRATVGRYGLNIADVQSIISGAVGGETIGETVEGLARYPISIRYPRDLRDSLEGLRQLPILTPAGQQITLGTVATIKIADGPPMLPRMAIAPPPTWVPSAISPRVVSDAAMGEAASGSSPGVSIVLARASSNILSVPSASSKWWCRQRC